MSRRTTADGAFFHAIEGERKGALLKTGTAPMGHAGGSPVLLIWGGGEHIVEPSGPQV